VERITENMTIAQVIRLNPQAVEILESYGTNCKKCPNIGKRTLVEVSLKHKIDLPKLLLELNQV